MARTAGIELGQITNFSGGPNFRDSPTEIAAAEAYGAYNCSFDERGGVQSRLGFIKRNLTPFGAGYKAQILAATPSLYWRFDEGVGALTALDDSGNGNVGSYDSGVSLGQPGLLTGDSNTAAAFDNTTSASVRAATYNPFVAGSQRTFMGWANRASTADDDTLFGATPSGLAPASLICLAGGNDVRWSARGGSPVTWAAAWPGTAQRVFWVLTYNDTTRVAELFINGVSKGQLTVATGYPASGTFQAGISPGNAAPWNGVLDEIAVFGTILSGATITTLYNLGVGGSVDLVVNDYYSQLLGVTLTQCGSKLYRADNTVSVHTFSTNACVTFTEINNLVIACHPVDGLWSSPDGAAWTKITATNAPLTNTLCVATWQARLFVGLTDGSVHWSDEGTIATWTITNFVEIWEKDEAPIVALHVGSGQDILGRPDLIAFKQDSVYRINDPTTGAYTTISMSEGAAGPKAVVGVGARVCWIGKQGIFWWRADLAAPVNASDLLRPAWRQEQLSFANQAGWAAGRRLNRARFSCSSAGSSVNDVAFELHPDEGWLVPSSDAMTCYSTSKGLTGQTYGGSPTAPGQMYQLDVGGTDDGQRITGWFQSRWLVPNAGFQAQVWQARLHGRGAGTVTFLTDYEDSGGSAFPFDFSATIGGFRYDNGVLYDSGALYGIVTLAETESVDGLGVCRQFALRFDFSSDSTAVGRSLFGNVPAPTVGAFALYGIDILHIPLGLS